MHHINTQQRTRQKEDTSQEAERQISLKLRARCLARDAMPVPDRTAIHGADEVGEETEGDHEESEEEEVHGEVDEGGGEGEEEQEREEDADCGDDFGVDKALFGPCGSVLFGVKVLACETCDGCGECELAEAKAEGEQVFCEHFDGCYLIILMALVLLKGY